MEVNLPIDLETLINALHAHIRGGGGQVHNDGQTPDLSFRASEAVLLSAVLHAVLVLVTAGSKCGRAQGEAQTFPGNLRRR